MNHPLFNDELLQQLPVYFGHMSSLEAGETEEQYESIIFSSSAKHQTDHLIKHGSYKPISEIDLKKLKYDQQLR